MIESASSSLPVSTASSPPPWLRLDRHELAGAFGDLGTSLPLLTGMILAAGFQPGAVLATFGALQILSALRYGMPMSVQPLKAVAALVITGHLRAPLVWGAGIAIGITMLLLQILGLVTWLGRRIPHVVIRGLQLALGIKLAILALGSFVPADGLAGFGLAVASAVLLVGLRRQRRVPPGLVLLLLGASYALARDPGILAAASAPRFAWPAMARIEPGDLWQGLVLLALPQLPLSLANSIYATERTVCDLFPHRRISAAGLSLSYAVMNLLAPFGGGVPVCHGAGGIAGHHAFGARTGGSVLLCGSAFMLSGLFLGDSFCQLVRLIPLPTLGVLLAREALAMAGLAADIPQKSEPVLLALFTASMAAFLPYGFGIALVAGTLLSGLLQQRKCDV